MKGWDRINGYRAQRPDDDAYKPFYEYHEYVALRRLLTIRDAARRASREQGVLDDMVLPALSQGGYGYLTQQKISQRFGGSKHLVDVVAEKEGSKYLVCLKWQQVSGTAEQKLPVEVICLADAVLSGTFSKAYVVLGEDWEPREIDIAAGLRQHLAHADKVDILTLAKFLNIASEGKL